MGDLSKNLSRHEMACRCHCGFDTVDVFLVEVLQDVVNHFSRKYGDCRLDITGGNRCKKYNDHLREMYRSTNGQSGANAAENSQHIFARAADHKITVRRTNKQVPPEEVYNYLDEKWGDRIALGLYVNRCHVDTRTGAGQRWGTT